MHGFQTSVEGSFLESEQLLLFGKGIRSIFSNNALSGHSALSSHSDGLTWK